MGDQINCQRQFGQPAKSGDHLVRVKLKGKGATIKSVNQHKLNLFVTFFGSRRSSIHSSSSSDSSRLSTSYFRDLMEKLKTKQYKDSTEKMYYSTWKTFDKKPTNWEDRLNLWVTYLIACEKPPTTVSSYISAVKAVLKFENIVVGNNSYILSSLLKACKIKNNNVTMRLPIQRYLLELMLEKIENYFLDRSEVYLATLYVAILSVGYHGLLRIGELSTGTHPIQMADIFISE